MDAETVDVVIVGAGIAGIAAARFYLEIHPTCRLVILERDTCAGGVWSSRRGYEGFWTQWTVGHGEWSDMRMPQPPEKDLYVNFFRAEHTTRYLERYIREHYFDGQSLHDRIRFGFRVTKIRKAGEQWVVQGNPDTKPLYSSKVIIASGMASTPNMPVLPGESTFEAPIIHQEAFGQSSVLSSADMHNVTVLGAGKSSADMVYACVKAGKSVTWIIKKTGGTGPGFLLSPVVKGPYPDAFAIGSTRIAATTSPSTLLPETWWTNFLHRTTYGRKLVKAIWAGADKASRTAGNFYGRQNALHGFENLSPHTPLFWQNGTGGLLHKEDFWDVVSQNVQVHLDDIVKIDKKSIFLRSGSEIATDVILCGTGWNKTPFDFFDPEEAVRLGLPHKLEDEKSEEATEWAHREARAESEILARFPMLADPPEHTHKPPTTTPYRLYNGIGPLTDNTIAFVGFISIANYFRGVECQAIWATAFLDRKLDLPALEARKDDVARTIAGCRKRYLSNGELGNFLPFESNLYLDKLLKEVGLTSYLRGRISHYFVPSKAQDLSGLKDEYIAKYGNRVTG